MHMLELYKTAVLSDNWQDNNALLCVGIGWLQAFLLWPPVILWDLNGNFFYLPLLLVAAPGGSVGCIAHNLPICRNRRHGVVVSTQLVCRTATVYVRSHTHLPTNDQGLPGTGVPTFTGKSDSPGSAFMVRSCIHINKSFYWAFWHYSKKSP